jgi:hypothetical protein
MEVTHEPPEFSIMVTRVRRSTSSITIEWKIPYNYEDDIDDYQITTRKEGSEDLLSSRSLPNNGTLYEIENLVVSSKYHICITANFKSGDAPSEQCEEFETLGFIRTDSIIAMVIVLGYILLMIIIGIICWFCAQRRLAAAEAEKEEDDVGVDQEEEELLTAKQDNNLLVPPPIYRPRNSIEEELPNIPYITPPLEELNREGVTNRKGYSSAANNI